jgi:hypothetical protein
MRSLRTAENWNSLILNGGSRELSWTQISDFTLVDLEKMAYNKKLTVGA